MEFIAILLLIVAVLGYLFFANRTLNNGCVPEPTWLFNRFDDFTTALGTAAIFGAAYLLFFTFVISYWPALLAGAVVYAYYAYRTYRVTCV